MGLTLAQKIIETHLVDGRMEPGADVGLRIDQTLTQDATGTMAYLEFEAMGIDRVKTELSVAYIDHNMLQTGFENPDDHRFIKSACRRFGLRFSQAGNGICHQVHLERFAAPGKTLIGSDSHTPTAGGIGALAFGAGGLDVAVAMGGGAYYITYPKMVRINLHGSLPPQVSAKDIILEVLRRLTVKGGVGKIIEYGGDGIASLSVPERATITNMGAELGTSTSIFPSDDVTKAFLSAQGREQDFAPLAPDPDAVYDETYNIDLSTLVPLAACPHSPDAVKPVTELTGVKVDQVCIGSCTNSSLRDMETVAFMLRGKTVHPDVSLTISPGSKQVLYMMAQSGALADIIAAGGRILESGCGPCIGMGQSPASGSVSLRTFNRNFKGRSGTQDAQVYLVSPQTAVASALAGRFADPRELPALDFTQPDSFAVDDSGILPPLPPDESRKVEIVRGPNIKEFPRSQPLPASLAGTLILKTGDNITTDDIMPAGSQILPFRSNIPYMSKFCFHSVDHHFVERAKEHGGGFIVGGHNYGQGSSREHAALVPLYLGVKAVIVKSFARIHKDNLVNAGILPLVFKNEGDYDKLPLLDELSLDGVRADIEAGKTELTLHSKAGGAIPVLCELTGRQRVIAVAGGLLNYTKGA